MKTFGVTMMKDEIDVARHVVMHMLDEVDGVLVADNMSTDNTREELHELAKRYPEQVFVVDDDDPAYYQSKKMTALAQQAHEKYGAEWIVPFDADEIWYSRKGRLREVLAELENATLVRAPLYNHFGTALDEKSEREMRRFLNPFESMVWRQREPGALPKVCVRWSEGAFIEQGNHGAWVHNPIYAEDTGIELRHFPYRSFSQFVTKARNGKKAYDATDLPDHQGSHWRGYGRILEEFGEDALRENVYEKYFWFFSPTDEGMVRDPAPFRRWQHEEVDAV